MSRHRRTVPLFPAFVIATLLVSAALPAFAQAQQALGSGTSLDDARRLTWQRETRAEGIATLRVVVARDPDSIDARFELGKVLTWNGTTRPEGTTILRRLAEDVPEHGDVAETLGEVLSWTVSTREEAVQRLRGLLEREPDRTSAKLILAEVLSWSSPTRDESETLYRSILRADASSIRATVGLARLLSWRGNLSESRSLYKEALSQEPGDVGARVGLAEMERRFGLARSSLSTLSDLPAGTLETPEAFQRRGEAYSDIGRPSRALREYEALLAVDPGNEAARLAVRSIQRGLRPVIEIGGDGSTESGDGATSRVQTSFLPLRFSWRPGGGDVEVALHTGLATYRNDRGYTRDTSAGAGFETPLGNRVRIGGDATLHDFEQDGRELTGGVQARLAVHDRLELQVGVAREQAYSSRMSLGGEPIDGVLYGPVLSKEVFVGAAWRPGQRWDLWSYVSRGTLEGKQIAANNRNAVFAGVGRSFHPGVLTLRPGYSLTWLSYDRDLSGFPPDDLGEDGIVRRGVGGYFSPFRFLNQMARFDATLPVGRSLLILAGGGIGQQHVEDIGSPDFSNRTTSSDGYLGFRLPVSDRVSLRGQISYQDVASAFDRTLARLSMAYSF